MPDETHLSARQVVIYWTGPLFPKSSVFVQKRMTVATRVAKQSIDDMLRSVSLWHAMCLLPAMDHQVGSNVIDSGRCRSHM